jgi:hypothetical protein
MCSSHLFFSYCGILCCNNWILLIVALFFFYMLLMLLFKDELCISNLFTDSKWPFIPSWYAKINFSFILNSSPTFMYGLHVLVDHVSIGCFMNSNNQKKIMKSTHKPSFHFNLSNSHQKVKTKCKSQVVFRPIIICY